MKIKENQRKSMKIIENLPQGPLGTPPQGAPQSAPPLDFEESEKLRKGKVEFTKGNFPPPQKKIWLLLAALLQIQENQ